MTLKDIIYMIPSGGLSEGLCLIDSPEDKIDHALENLAADYQNKGDLEHAGMAKAMQVMFVALTLDNVSWAVIKDTLVAMLEHID